MNIISNGDAGYIASHTVSELVKEGYNVIVAESLSTGNCCAVPKSAKFYQEGHSQCRFVVLQ